jgi:hypothetical protein
MEVLFQNPSGSVGDPVGDQKRLVFGEISVVEHQQKLSSIRPHTLKRVRKAGREEPYVSRRNVIDENLAIRSKHRNASGARDYICPFVGCVPVQLAIAPRGQAHLDACHFLGCGKVMVVDLISPATFLDPPMSQVKGIPE